MLALLRSRRAASASLGAIAKPAARPLALQRSLATVAGAKIAPPTGPGHEPPKPKVLMKKGLTSYLQPPAFEITVPPLVPYMSKYQRRLCRNQKPVQPIAFKLYGEGLKVNLTPDGRTIEVEAKMGKASLKLHESVVAAITDGYVVFSAVPMHLEAKAMMGTMRTHLANFVHGVHFGHSRRLKLVGIGYRAKVEGKQLELRVGFSHPVLFNTPEGVTPSMPGKDVIQLKGIDIHQVMQCAAELRRVRPPNAYTGQGIRYSNEVFVAKPGKKKTS